MGKAKKEIVLDANYDDSFDEILLDGVASVKKNEIQQMPINKLTPFANHPFKVLDDENMAELVDSIRERGILSPVVVRPKGNLYELISGHRRTHAARAAGLTEIPVVVRDMSDEEATILMVDANIQREEILPSERAHSLKMKIEALNVLYKHGELKGKRSRDLAGEEAGLSGRQVQRYLNLNDLNPGFLDRVDDGRMQMSLGLEIASMRPEVQQWLFEYADMGAIISSTLIKKLKSVEETEGLDKEVIGIIIHEDDIKPKARKITISERKLNKYFSSSYSISDMESVIFSLLDQWKIDTEGETN